MDAGNRPSIAGTLEALVCALMAAGVTPDVTAATRAARFLGAAGALRRAIGAPLPPARRAEVERATDTAAAVLGGAAFEAALIAGQASPLREILSTVLPPAHGAASAAPEPGGNGTPEGAIPASVLTRREREVTALVSRGLTNREIARQLTVTEGTVGTHVEHILAKLGLRSRTQVATWAVRAAPDAPPLA